MAKYKARVYLSTFVDIEVEANSEFEARMTAETDSDKWYSAENQILENVKVDTTQTVVELLYKSPSEIIIHELSCLRDNEAEDSHRYKELTNAIKWIYSKGFVR